uniref:Leucine rich repeats and calponin homology domain containing 3 n=1 Tax=Malurus cyaneus samueli TaxID=2593467 RepID=A0A8C5U0X7_9PASS
MRVPHVAAQALIVAVTYLDSNKLLSSTPRAAGTVSGSAVPAGGTSSGNAAAGWSRCRRAAAAHALLPRALSCAVRLDRALEEAAVSGTLSLSGRKLRDYPRASAAQHDLSDTTQAELAELPLIRLDFSCNKITTIPVCYRNLRHLQSIMLENNPLQSPPAQICIKGKIHIFKYLNIEACKIAPDLPDYDRRPMGFGSCHEELYSGRPYGALDSGFNSVDSGDKRWSGNEPTDEFSDLPLRVAEITKEQRLRRESQYQENRGSAVISNGGVEHDLDQIDYIDSCATEEEEEESSPVKPVSIREFQRAEDTRRHLHQNRPLPDSPYFLSLSSHHTQVPNADSELHRRHIERTRREAQLAALQYEEERMRTKQIQREAVLDFVKFVLFNYHIAEPISYLNSNHFLLPPSFPVPFHICLVHLSPPYPGHAAPPSYRNPSQRPESFLFRTAVRDEAKKAVASSSTCALSPADDSADARVRQNSKQREEELQLIEQLRKNIESRLKVSLPSDLGAALTDGVVLCHLANHVRPRSVPSIHVPSPAVPRLTMAKCRRNVENFLEACRRIGVPQEQLCLPLHILEEKGLTQVAVTVQALLELAPPKQQPLHHLSAV